MNIIAQACCERTAQEAGGVKVFSLRVEDARKELLNEFQPGRHVVALGRRVHWNDGDASFVEHELVRPAEIAGGELRALRGRV